MLFKLLFILVFTVSCEGRGTMEVEEGKKSRVLSLVALGEVEASLQIMTIRIMTIQKMTIQKMTIQKMTYLQTLVEDYPKDKRWIKRSKRWKR